MGNVLKNIILRIEIKKLKWFFCLILKSLINKY